MLTQQQIDQYHEDGYVVPDFQLSTDVIEKIREDHTKFVSRHPEFIDYCPAILAYDTSFLNYARFPQILDMVEQVIGSDFALWNSSFFAKPAKNGRKTPWHQDGQYWPIRPIATCTVWIAVDDSTVENGCLKVLRGSHKVRELRQHQTNETEPVTLKQELPGDEIDVSKSEDIVLKAGQISLHDVFLVHGSEANTSDNPRRGMTLRFMPTSSVFERELARSMSSQPGHLDQSQRTLFLMRGKDLSGKNDFRMHY